MSRVTRRGWAALAGLALAFGLLAWIAVSCERFTGDATYGPQGAAPAVTVTVAAPLLPAPAAVAQVVAPLSFASSGSERMPVFRSHVSSAVVGRFPTNKLVPVCWDKTTGRMLVTTPTPTGPQFPEAWIEYPDAPTPGSLVNCD